MNHKFKTGIIVGKFYPPHKGHHFLINTGIKNTEKLTVIVCEGNNQFISGEQRADWIREVHPGVRVIVARDNISVDQSPEDYSKAWADYTIGLLGYIPEVAFTSEEYGERWAKYMGSRHVLVDIKRSLIPCSGTLIRSNPLKYLNYLEPCVKKYFVKKFA